MNDLDNDEEYQVLQDEIDNTWWQYLDELEEYIERCERV